jgi:hypothetical protein
MNLAARLALIAASASRIGFTGVWQRA